MTLQGTGIGLRRAHLGPLAETVPETIDFLEAAPENWIGIGGRQARRVRFFPQSGNAKQMLTAEAVPADTAPPRSPIRDRRPAVPPGGSGEVELF